MTLIKVEGLRKKNNISIKPGVESLICVNLYM